MNAKEARLKSLESLKIKAESTVQNEDQYKKIKKSIIESVNNGKFHVHIYECIDYINREKLIEEGFDVMCNYDYDYYIGSVALIKW
jgi:hypothetical protein